MAMTIKDFRRIALSFEGAEEGLHMGAVDFRVGGRIFCTLAHAKKGYGNLMLKPEQQAMFVGELPEIFIPVAGEGSKTKIVRDKSEGEEETVSAVYWIREGEAVVQVTEFF